jgi:Domain of unknown function (DUF4271)
VLAEKKISYDFALAVPSHRGRQPQHSRSVVHSKPAEKQTQKVNSKAITAKSKVKKEIPKKKIFSEESSVSDAQLNIYTGNPGFDYSAGSNDNFGTVYPVPDSIFLKQQITVAVKEVKPYGFIGKQRIVTQYEEWGLALILILWMIFASVRVGFPKYLGQIFDSLINFNSASRLFRQAGYRTMYGAVRLDAIFHLILPLAVFQIAQYYKLGISGYPTILLFIGLLIILNGYLFIKFFIYRIVGSITMLKEQTEELIFNNRLYFRALGFILMPIVTIHAILEQTNFITIWVMAVLIVLMYIAAVLRSFYLGYYKDISIFYLILYLCTLEILPLLLIFKLIMVA